MSSEKNANGSGASQLPAWLGAIASVAGLILAALLVCKHTGVCTSSLGCTINGTDGCAELGASPDSQILGIPIAWFGFFYYVLMGALFSAAATAADARRVSLSGLLAIFAVFGFVFDLFLAYKNFFEFETPCTLCTYTYLAQIGVLVAALWMYLPAMRAGSPEDLSVGGLAKAGAQSWYAFVGALVACGVLALVLFVPGGGQAQPPKPAGFPLLSMEEVPTVLREFRALKTAEVANEHPVAEGESQAYIHIHDWFDFQCPHCKHASDEIKRLKERWPGRIRVYYRNFPLDGTCNPLVSREGPGYSCNGALALNCAAEQGRGSDMYHALMQFQIARAPIDAPNLKRLAEQMNLNWPQLSACMGSAGANQLLQGDIQEARRVGVEATPTLVIENRVHRGAPRMEWFVRVIDALVLEQEGEAAVEEFRSRGGG